MYKSILAAAVFLAPALGQAADSTPSTPLTTDTTALLNQVVQIASAGQTPETQTEVRKFVEENKGALAAILNETVNYVNQQLQTTGSSGSAGSANSAIASTPATPPPPPQAPASSANSTPMQAGAMQAATGMPGNSVQPSGGLQTSSVQPSGGLQTGHLAGYPSLPDVDPTTSVKSLTPGQIDYVEKVNAENEARKKSLEAQSAVMGH